MPIYSGYLKMISKDFKCKTKISIAVFILYAFLSNACLFCCEIENQQTGNSRESVLVQSSALAPKSGFEKRSKTKQDDEKVIVLNEL